MKSKRIAILVLTVGLLLVGRVAAQTAAPPAILIDSGFTTAPDGSIYVLDSVMVPVLNASGQIAFRANLVTTSSPTGIIAGTPGSLQIVAKQGTPAPAGGNYNILNEPVFNSNGQVAFIGSTSVNGNGQFARTLGFPATTAALVGTPTPATGNYATLNAHPVVNASGQVAFLARTSFDDFAIFAGTPGTTLTTVALQGSPAPVGGNYSQLTNPAINSTGKVVFRASLTNCYGLFFGTPGTTLTTVAHSSNTTPAGGVFGVFSSVPAVNSAGQVAFVTNRNGDFNSAIFAGTAGSTLTSVAVMGNAAPAGGNYSTMGDPALNANGQVAFLANLTRGSSNRGIFVGTPGQPLQTIALHGAAAPNGGGATYSGLSNPSLNASGQVAFTSILTGAGVNFSNNVALYAGSPGNVVQIVRTGDLVDIDPGPAVSNRVVSAITFLSGGGSVTGSGGEDGRISSFNDSGALIYRLDYTSSGRGIFMSNIDPVITPGDFNGDGTVDAADYVMWRKTGDPPGHYNTWRTNFGNSGSGAGGSSNATVPEPATSALIFIAIIFGVSRPMRRGSARSVMFDLTFNSLGTR
jgi:hypothetical protein